MRFFEVVFSLYSLAFVCSREVESQIVSHQTLTTCNTTLSTVPDTLPPNSIVGEWCGSEQETKEYFLKIKTNKDKYVIYYCFSNLDGSVIDCPGDSISINLHKNENHKVTFTNSFNEKLNYEFRTENDTLKFFLRKGNVGFSLFKTEMNFIKCEEQ